MKKLKVRATASFTDHSSAMTDQCFLLIVFFLVVASFTAAKGLPLILPDPDTGPKELTPDKAVVITLDPGSKTIDGIPVSLEEFPRALKAAIDAKRPEAVIIEPGVSVSYGEVMNTLETAKASGATAFSIASPNQPIPVEIKDGEK